MEEEPQISESVTGTKTSGRTPTERHIILQRISRQLVALDQEESTESINRKRLELKRLWNSALLIHTRVPDELLTQIFTNLQADPQVSSLKLSSHSTSEEPDGASPITAWHDLMLVCSYWRNLLVSTPAFWQAVEMKRHVEWTNLCLVRSAAASLDVYARIRDQYALDTLYPHVNRFQKLFFSAGFSKSQIQVALPPLLGSGMPLLEHLEFCTGLSDRQRPSVDLDPYVTSHRFPRLQTLVLQRVVSPGDKPLYAQLRKLSMFRCFHNLSFDSFIDALAGCAQLEELTLDDTLHNFSNNP
ncbi:hypothetical protein V8D89_000633 [Ganoderma adspersum]